MCPRRCRDGWALGLTYQADGAPVASVRRRIARPPEREQCASQRDLAASRHLVGAIVLNRAGWLACGASRVVAMAGWTPGGTIDRKSVV